MGSLDIKISPQPDSKAIASQKMFPMSLRVIDADSRKIIQSGENDDKRGQTLMRLAEKDSTIRLHPGIMTPRITFQEFKLIQENLLQALYQLGVLTGSETLNRHKRVKPFNIAMTIPRFLERMTQHVVPATAENLASGFPRFFMDDPETQRIREELSLTTSKSRLSTIPFAGLVMETPGIRRTDDPKPELMVRALAAELRLPLELNPLDISSAIQMAIQATYSGQPGKPADHGSGTMLLTDKTTKRGRRIAVSSIPNSKIALREVCDENHAAYELARLDPIRGRSKQKTTMAVSTMAVFRPLA